MRTQRIAIALTAINLVLLLTALTHNRTPEISAPSPVLRGQALEIVDEQGRVRSRINVEEGGEVVFRLTDQEGTIRVKLGASKDGSGLMLANDATEPGVHMLAKSSGTRLTLKNKNGQERIITP